MDDDDLDDDDDYDDDGDDDAEVSHKNAAGHLFSLYCIIQRVCAWWIVTTAARCRTGDGEDMLMMVGAPTSPLRPWQLQTAAPPAGGAKRGAPSFLLLHTSPGAQTEARVVGL